MPSDPAWFIAFLILLRDFLTTYIDSHREPEPVVPPAPWWSTLPRRQRILYDPAYSWCPRCQCRIRTEGHENRCDPSRGRRATRTSTPSFPSPRTAETRTPHPRATSNPTPFPSSVSTGPSSPRSSSHQPHSTPQSGNTRPATSQSVTWSSEQTWQGSTTLSSTSTTPRTTSRMPSGSTVPGEPRQLPTSARRSRKHRTNPPS